MIWVQVQRAGNLYLYVHGTYRLSDSKLTTSARHSNMSAGLNQDDSKLVFESSEKVSVISTFDQLNLKEDLLRGIYAYSK